MAVGVGFVLALLVGTATAVANHSTPKHWHNRNVKYRINVEMPRKDAIQRGGAEWALNTKLELFRGDTIGHKDPSTPAHIVWRGSIPANWQDGCPPGPTIACTRTRWGGDNHIDDTDMVFNRNKSFTEGCFGTNLSPLVFEMETVAVHEFGHWGYLEHTSDGNSVMFPSYQGPDCTVSGHDINAMNNNYDGH